MKPPAWSEARLGSSTVRRWRGRMATSVPASSAAFNAPNRARAATSTVKSTMPERVGRVCAEPLNN
jgi:hypothetical protein